MGIVLPAVICGNPDPSVVRPIVEGRIDTDPSTTTVHVVVQQLGDQANIAKQGAVMRKAIPE